MSRKKQINSSEAGEKPAEEKGSKSSYIPSEGSLILENIQWERFCRHYVCVSNGNGVESYKAIYGKDLDYNTAAACASKLLKKHNIKERIKVLFSLNDYKAKDAEINFAHLAVKAESAKQINAAVLAESKRAQIAGHLVERTVNDNYNRDVTTPEELVRKAEEALRVIKSVLPGNSDTLATAQNKQETAVPRETETETEKVLIEESPVNVEPNAIRPPAGDKE